MEPLDLLNQGVAIIPCAPKSKTPTVRWREYQKRLPTAIEYNRWFYPGNSRNAAAVCGWNGLTIIDFDDTTSYGAWLAWATLQGSTARQVATTTYRVRTARGMHVYVYVAEPTRCSHTDGIDIKSTGGYVMIPPSVHPSGIRYTVVDCASPILSIDSLRQVLRDAPEPPKVRMPQPVHVAPSSSLWPSTTIERILDSLPILSLFPDAIQTGDHWYMVRCPFHDDKHESMWIDTNHGICGCYAGCTPKPLDVIDLYAKLHGVTTRDAIRELRTMLPAGGGGLKSLQL